MPGYGIADAATTLVGQSIGAGRRELVRRFSHLTVMLGMGVMSVTGAVMFFAAPFMLSLLTLEPQIQELGVRVLRIEAFAEPLFAASIVVSGALRGAGDTLVPSLMNFISIVGLRLCAHVGYIEEKKYCWCQSGLYAAITYLRHINICTA